MDDEMDRRLKLAADLFAWSESRVAAFREGYADHLAGKCDVTRFGLHQPDHGWHDPSLSPELLDSLGYGEGYLTSKRATMPILDLSGDPDRVDNYAAEWSCNADEVFDAADANWAFDPSASLDIFLSMDSREGWAAWIAEEHKDSIGEERSGYAQLLLEDILEPVVILVGDDGKIDIWDGWHRIAACMAKGAAGIPMVMGKPHAPAPSP